MNIEAANRVAPERVAAGPDGLSCLCSAPINPGANTTVLVAVHGVQRLAEDYFDAFAPLVRSIDGLLLVPIFDRDRFPDYQRLGRPDRGRRADLALLNLLPEVFEQFGLNDRPVHLFGHSGGGQFVHRFVMAHPRHVSRYVVSAAGWYTFPDETHSYPRGMNRPLDGTTAFQASDFLKIPGCVFIGTHDRRSGPNLRRSDAIDHQQGVTRHDRAYRWAAAMNELAINKGLSPPLRICEFRDAGHNFKGLIRNANAHVAAWSFLTENATRRS